MMNFENILLEKMILSMQFIQDVMIPLQRREESYSIKHLPVNKLLSGKMSF